MREKERGGGGSGPLDYYSRPRPHFNSSFSDRQVDVQVGRESLYRSNSSLELMGCEMECGPNLLRREYGSHGSIDVISSPDHRDAGSFFDMLQDMRPTVGADQRSPGPQQLLSTTSASDDRCSPKAGRRKFAKFWAKTPGGGAAVGRCEVDGTNGNTDGEAARRRVFAHYDVQSLSANLSYAARLRGILAARRRNIATGASAASLPRAATPDSPEQDDDPGDTNNNQLIQSCPFFRNEVGGEEERTVWLGRALTSCKNSSGCSGQGFVHRPTLACGMSVLEYSRGETHWTSSTCPYSQRPRPLEQVDRGAHYYRDYFQGKDHQNWFGMDDNLGPVAVSLRRERVESPGDQVAASTLPLYRYRVVIRTSELLTLRGSILEDAIPNIKSTNSNKAINTKEVLEYVAPEVQLSCLRLGVSGPETEDSLMKLDEQGLSRQYKVGIMYCRAGQSTEEQMYNNQESSPVLTEFLDSIGQTVRLKGFDKYRAGLDNKTDSTGLYSVYAQHQDCEIMFHVSTLLPFTPNNRQQLLRKRHIGNDIVTIVFQEPGAHPFTPRVIRSQFQHVFIVVRAVNPCTDNAHYSVAVSRSKEVAVFGPPIPEGGTFPKGKTFTDFLLAKVINAENAAHRSEKFATMATRTRQEYLKDLVTNYTTNIMVETTQKFSIISFSSKKKERWRGRAVADSTVRGAVSWQVLLDDSSQSVLVECFLAISSDSLVLVEEASREIVFATPTTSILGWSINTNSLRVYYHQGECITFHMKEGGERDELIEVVVRLRSITNGSVTEELSLKRNTLGQLGFHVQPDGVVTQVEHKGLAWVAGLRQAARLVEICKVAVSTLSHDQMIDLLKTSVAVTVTVIPPNTDGSVKKGCSEQSCKYNSHFEGDYENVNNQDSRLNKTARQQPVSKSNRYERSFSPPRSSNSSGYGTGSSSKSFSGDKVNNLESTVYQSVESNHEDFKVGEVVTTCLMKAERSHQLRRNMQDYAHTTNGVEYSNGLDYGSDVKSSGSPERESGRQQITHSTSDTETSSTSTDRLLPFPSEEDLSGGSSPGGLRRSKTTGCLVVRNDSPMGSTGSPRSSTVLVRDSPRGSAVLLRESSPRSQTECSPRSSTVLLRESSPRSQTECSPRSSAVMRDSGEPRRRPQSTYNRNSASLSTLQQDLIRLINPDSEPPDLPNNATPDELKAMRESGRRARCKESGSPSSQRGEACVVAPSQAKDKPPQEVILTMARPATVISTSSNSYTESIHDSTVGRVVKRKVLPWPEPGQEMDWPSLVDTATKAMMTLEPGDSHETLAHHNSRDREHELSKQISQLEGKLSRETMRRLSLEEEVRGLREENRRLQHESQSAAQQLRRFTEWFFQTIDKQ